MIRGELSGAVISCFLLTACATTQGEGTDGKDATRELGSSAAEQESDRARASSPSQEELAQEAQLALDMFLRDQKVLFAKGESEFELGLQVTTDSRRNVRFGETIVPALSQQTSSLSVQLRYGLTDDLEVSLRLPYSVDRTEVDYAFLSSATSLQDRRDSGIGDAQVRLRYQLVREMGYRPDLAIALLYKADTADDGNGSGDQSIGLGATVVKTIDPAVFFLQTQYTYATAVDGVQRGANYALQFGSGFSLNDRVGYSIRYGLSYTERTSVGDLGIRGTSQLAGNLMFGTTVQLSRNMFFEPMLSVGITEEAPDAGFSFSLTF